MKLKKIIYLFSFTIIIIIIGFISNDFRDVSSKHTTHLNNYYKNIKVADSLLDESNYTEAIKRYNIALYSTNNYKTTIFLKIAESYRSLNKLDSAQHYINIVEKLITSETDNTNKDLYIHYKARLLSSNEFYNDAISMQMSLLKTNQSNKFLTEIYKSLGKDYYLMEFYDSALFFYNKAIVSCEINKDFKNLCNLYFNNALIYQKQGKFDKAKDTYRICLDASNKLNLIKKKYFKYRVYNSLGLIFKELGLYNDALSNFNNALEYANIKSDKQLVYSNIGIIYRLQGDYSKSLSYYNQALVDNTNNKEISIINNNIGSLYYYKKEFENSKQYFEKSIQLDNNTNLITKSNHVRNFASVCDELGKNKEANNNYQKAATYIQLSGLDNYSLLGEIYMDYGEFKIKHSENIKGLSYYNKSEQIFKKNFSDKHPLFSQLYSNYGDYYFKNKNYISSLQYFQKALIAITIDFNSKDIYQNPKADEQIISDIDLLKLFDKKAEVFHNLYIYSSGDTKDLETSLFTYQEQIELINKVRTGYNSYESKQYLCEKQNKVYSNAIDVAYELYDKTGNNKYNTLAFEIAEKAKAGTLYEQLRENYAVHYASVPDTLIFQEKNLKQEIASYQKLIYEEKINTLSDIDQEKIEIWEGKLFNLNKQFDELKTFYKTNYKDYFNYKYINKVYDNTYIQSTLANNQAIIEYFIGENSLYTFLLTNKNFKVIRTSIDSSFYENIDNLYNNVASTYNTADAHKEFIDFTKNSYDLYRTLLEPIEQEIQNKNLTIIQDGVLGYVSFETLITKEVKTNVINYKDLPYLILNHNINNAYSSALLINANNKKSSSATQNFIAFAPSIFAENQENNQLALNTRERGESLVNLPGSEIEVGLIQKIMGGVIFTGIKATKARFLEEASKYKILHIATHGIVDNVNPLYSKLVFSKDENSTVSNCLTTNELFSMKLNADLAVLSACKTGYGKNVKGEGLMTLSRGFLYSGVPSLIISLWNVNDQTSVPIMENFYKYLKQGYSKDEALRLSKIDYLKSSDRITSKPYYWASFVNVGNNAPLSIKDDKSAYLTLYIFSIISLTLFFIAIKLFNR